MTTNKDDSLAIEAVDRLAAESFFCLQPQALKDALALLLARHRMAAPAAGSREGCDAVRFDRVLWPFPNQSA